MSDDDFGAWIADSRVGLDAEIARARRHVAPDFAAVVAEAHARAPSIVAVEAVREAGEFAPIVALDRSLGDLAQALSDSDLDSWIADAQQQTEAAVAARRLIGVPTMPTASAEPAARGWGRRWAGPLVLAAAVVGLAIALPRMLDEFLDGNYLEADTNPNQAEFVGPEPGVERGQVRIGPQLGPIESVAPVVQRAVQMDRPPADSSARDRRPPPRRATSPASNQHARDRIAELDAEAQARWTAGDLDGAEQRFRAIIELADHRHRRFADLAYGDLFTLARQRHDEAVMVELWREYLERFPRGRFADDARAGLCIRAPEVEQTGCWTAYLDEFPSGVHARTGQQALGEAEPDSGGR